MRATFVRNAESTTQTGAPADDRDLSPLSELGIGQAEAFAAAWPKAPDLVAVSPIKRSQLTAQPFLRRFEGTPVQLWEIQGFEYLAPERWTEDSASEREERVEEFWRAADPAFTDGPKMESFSSLLRRTEMALRRLTAMPIESEIVLFSHYDFMNALRQTVTLPELNDKQKMERYIADSQARMIPNTGTLVLERQATTAWRVAD